jgi:hypothetical protein
VGNVGGAIEVIGENAGFICPGLGLGSGAAEFGFWRAVAASSGSLISRLQEVCAFNIS